MAFTTGATTSVTNTRQQTATMLNYVKCQYLCVLLRHFVNKLVRRCSTITRRFPPDHTRNRKLTYMTSSFDHRKQNKDHPQLTYYYRLRGSASTVLTATGQVNGRWQILTPTESKPMSRLQQNSTQLIMSARGHPKPNMVQIHSLGASEQMNEI